MDVGLKMTIRETQIRRLPQSPKQLKNIFGFFSVDLSADALIAGVIGLHVVAEVEEPNG